MTFLAFLLGCFAYRSALGPKNNLDALIIAMFGVALVWCELILWSKVFSHD